jgi:hypothetical protein
MVGRLLSTTIRPEIESVCRLYSYVFNLKFKTLLNKTSKFLILVVIVSRNNETT